MVDENDDTAGIDADDEHMDAGKKITLKEFCNASAGLDFLVEKSAWKLGEQSLEDETKYFELLSKPHIDNALPLPKRARVSEADE